MPSARDDSRDEGEHRASFEHPDCVTRVGDKGVEASQSALIAALFGGLPDAADRHERRAPRFDRGHPGLKVRLDLPLEVIAQLLIELAVDERCRRRANEDADARSARVDRRSCHTSGSVTTIEIAPARRAHDSLSLASWRLPERVSE